MNRNRPLLPNKFNQKSLCRNFLQLSVALATLATFLVAHCPLKVTSSILHNNNVYFGDGSMLICIGMVYAHLN